MSKYVPFATRRRLPLYYKVFHSLKEQEVEYITSSELSLLIKFDSTTIRRDFSTIGRLGKKGQGYHIKTIISIFEEEFELRDVESMILVGLGHLGSAIVKYFDVQSSYSFISQIYEVDSTLVGTTFMSIEIFNYKDIENKLDKTAKIAILTVPGEYAQDTLEKLVKLGIKGIINFTGTKIYCNSEDVIINDIDITQTVQSLLYDIKVNF